MSAAGAVPWFDLRMAGFDIETTGTDLEAARIVTAAAVLVGGGIVPESLTFMADPGVPIPEEAAAIHGVTTERAQVEGAPAHDVLTAVRAVLSTIIDAGYPLVVFNARFDLTILDRELRRHDLEPLPAPLVVDPLVIDKWLHRYRRGSRKLDAMCEHYGATLDGAHAADSDALAACRLAWVLAAKARVNRRAEWEREPMQAEWDRVRVDLPALHAAQVGWAAEQAEGLAQHFARQGKAQHVEAAWPLVPLPSAVAA
jgi:DNA polymerase III epsilon subunit-like protein